MTYLLRCTACAAVFAATLVHAPGATALPLQPESRPLYTWNRSAIEDDRILSAYDAALKVDSQGRAHIAYAGDKLYYARVESDTVTTEVIDARGGSYGYVSIALDIAQQPVIGFGYARQGVASQIGIARRITSSWQTTIVDSATDLLGNTSIAVDDSNHMRLAYPHGWSWSRQSESVRVAQETGSGWVNVEVPVTSPFTQTAGSCSSSTVGISIDASQQSHVAWGNTCFFQQPAQLSQHSLASQTSLTWALTSTVGTSNLVGLGVNAANTPVTILQNSFGLEAIDSFATDAMHQFHMATVTFSETARIPVLSYAGCVSCTQTSPAAIGVVATGSGVGAMASAIDMDAQGRPHLVFSGESSSIRYARWTGSAWKTIVIDADIFTLDRNKQLVGTLDAAGMPIIAFIDGARRLRVAQHISNTWKIDHLADDAQAVAITSDTTGVDAGTPELGYVTGGVFVHARLSGSGWLTDVIASLGQPVEGPVGIALDANDAAHAFIYRTPGTIEHYRQSGAAWLPQVVSVPTTSVVRAGALMRDPSGGLVMALSDSGFWDPQYDYPIGTSLVFKRWNAVGNEWIDAGIPRLDNVEPRAIALDNAGWPRVLHRPPTASQTAWACSFSRWTGTAWVTIPDVAECQTVALAIGPNNVTTFAGYANNGDLVFSQRLGIDFNYEKVGTTRGPIWLGINTQGQPLIVSLPKQLTDDGALSAFIGIPRSFAFLPQVTR